MSAWQGCWREDSLTGWGMWMTLYCNWQQKVEETVTRGNGEGMPWGYREFDQREDMTLVLRIWLDQHHQSLLDEMVHMEAKGISGKCRGLAAVFPYNMSCLVNVLSYKAISILFSWLRWERNMDEATQELEGMGDSRYTCMFVRQELKSSGVSQPIRTACSSQTGTRIRHHKTDGWGRSCWH